MAREKLPEAIAAPHRRPPGLWRTLVARETQAEAPPPAPPRRQSFLGFITRRETLPEETTDVR